MARRRRTAKATKIIVTGASLAATVGSTAAIASADHGAAVARHDAELDGALVPAPPVVTTLAPRIVVIPRPTGGVTTVPGVPVDGGAPAGTTGVNEPARTAPDASAPAPGPAADPSPAPSGGGGTPPPTAPPATAPPATSPPTTPPTTPPPTTPPTTSSGGS